MSQLRESIRVGVAGLFANPLRTVLSTLGVIIGVGSLVSVLSVGDGLENTLREQLESTTSLQYLNLVPVTTEEVDGQQFPLDVYPQFSLQDTRDAGAIAGLAGVTAQLVGRSEVSDADKQTRRLVSITATTETAQQLTPLPLHAGRTFTSADVDDADSSRVVLSLALAERFAEAAALSSVDHVIDRIVFIEEHPFTVVGITADADGAELAWVPLSAAERAFAPSTRPRNVLLLAKLARLEEADSVRAQLQQWADRRFGAGTTSIRSNEARLAQASQGILLFKLFMGSITGISLVVGGIGIMNVLLASVTERTREIGIRKAMGARGKDVLWQFLAESVAVASLGSALGVALGLAAAFSITAVMRARIPEMQIFASVSLSTILVAVSSAVCVGLVFGTYPARRAARLNPIDAIRHE